MTTPIQLELPTPYSIGPVSSVNAWLFTEPEPTLIDCGLKTEESRLALEAGLAQQGLKLEDIRHVVITHAHEDHSGLARIITERSEAQVWVSDVAYDWCVNLPTLWEERMRFFGDILHKAGQPTENRERIWQGRNRSLDEWESIPAERITRFPIDGVLEFGGAQWRSLYAPGHTYTQTCFYQLGTKQLFSADMLLKVTPVAVIEQYPDRPQERIPGLLQFVESMKKFQTLDVSTVYPGHGEAFTDHTKLIQWQLRRIVERKEQCLGLVREGYRTPYEISEVMYSHYPKGARFTGFAMTIGYLDLLMSEGLVERQERNGIWDFKG